MLVLFSIITPWLEDVDIIQLYLLIEDDEVLEKYCVREKVTVTIEKELDCKPIYNKKIRKTKIKSYGAVRLQTFTKKKYLK